MSQAHGSGIWQEPAGAGATPAIVPLYLVAAGGTDTVMGPDGLILRCAETGPDEIMFGVVRRDGTYTRLNVAPVPVTPASGDLVMSAGGVAGAILADGGSGNLELTTNLARAAVADLYDAVGGDRWLAIRPLSRLTLTAVRVRGVAHLY